MSRHDAGPGGRELKPTPPRVTRPGASRSDDAPGHRDPPVGEWPPPAVRRFNRMLKVLEVVATLLLPNWVQPQWPGRGTPERRLEFLTWLVIASVVALLVLGAWLAGLIPPGPSRRP